MTNLRVVGGELIRIPDVECAPDWQCHDLLFYRITEPVSREWDAERIAVRDEAQQRARRRVARRAALRAVVVRVLALAAVVAVIMWGPRMGGGW